MFKSGWEKEQATLIDQVRVKTGTTSGKKHLKYEVWDFMVELPGPDGAPTRMVIRAKSFDVDLPAHEKGRRRPVPVRVSPKRDKVEFDMDDPRISFRARIRLGKARDKRRDAERRERFERRLGERD